MNQPTINSIREVAASAALSPNIRTTLDEYLAAAAAFNVDATPLGAGRLARAADALRIALTPARPPMAGSHDLHQLVDEAADRFTAERTTEALLNLKNVVDFAFAREMDPA